MPKRPLRIPRIEKVRNSFSKTKNETAPVTRRKMLNIIVVCRSFIQGGIVYILSVKQQYIPNMVMIDAKTIPSHSGLTR